MARRTFAPRLLVLAAAIVAPLALSQPAAASCIRLPPLEKALADAPITFVGTVVGTKNDGRTATFDVEEVWKGSVGPRVVVIGGPEIDAVTSVDRTYEAGVRYLVVPFGAKGSVLTDNACSSTQPYTARLARHAPPGAAPPPDESAAAGPSALAPGDAQESGIHPWQLVLAVLGMAILLALALTMIRRTRRPRSQ